MTRISFAVPTFNRAHLIAESIASIARVMTPADELIVIDDGSTDATAEVVAGCGVPHRYERQANAGKSRALNRALELARGEFFWICDDDDLMEPGSVEPMVAAVTRGDGVDWAFGRNRRFYDDGGEHRALDAGYWPDLSGGSVIRHIMEDLFVMQNATIARRSAYLALGGHAVGLPRSVDYEMALRLALSFRGRFVDHIIYSQREHGGDRGTAGERNPASKSTEVWRRYDGMIFDHLRQQLPLAFFESMFDQPNDTLRRRTALLQRACIEARHDRWSVALADLDAAFEIPEAPLGDGDIAICRRFLQAKHGLGPDHETGGDGLAQLHGQGGVRRAAVDNILRGAAWRLRSDDGEERRGIWRFMTRILGTLGAPMALARWKLAADRQPVNAAGECDPYLIPPGSIPPVG